MWCIHIISRKEIRYPLSHYGRGDATDEGVNGGGKCGDAMAWPRNRCPVRQPGVEENLAPPRRHAATPPSRHHLSFSLCFKDVHLHTSSNHKPSISALSQAHELHVVIVAAVAYYSRHVSREKKSSHAWSITHQCTSLRSRSLPPPPSSSLAVGISLAYPFAHAFSPSYQPPLTWINGYTRPLIFRIQSQLYIRFSQQRWTKETPLNTEKERKTGVVVLKTSGMDSWYRDAGLPPPLP
ncbi:hypothetical protein B0T17DRAFT_193233 [Bombardia bombarda]|uniref:Uncharacterized protein n=1 Tax=Bombardia bombarda TaxID=252184 RepID=A0AA39X971_9PEZI|nr:hypothetical protein B0T17DRAFT_193233 [Bombardia bombarda]